MLHRYTTFIKAINLTADYVILNLGMITSYVIVDKSFLFWSNQHYFPVVLVFNLAWLFATQIAGLYEHVLTKDSIKTFQAVIKTYLIFLSIISIIILSVGNKAYFVTREFIFFALIISGFLLCFWKLIFLSIRKSERASLINKRSFVIVGGGTVATELKDFFKENPDMGYQLKGVFDSSAHKPKYNGSYIGDIDECVAYITENEVDEIFCTLPNSQASQIEKLMLAADKNLVRFKFVPEYFDFNMRPTIVESVGHIPVISMRAEPLENMLNRFVKRLFDIGFSVFIIVFVLSWLYPILAILIKLESKGPVLFVQQRSGRDNKPFSCFKFRSMKVNSESNNKQATRNDRRITKIGAFLRRSSIDELPQFFNVLIGNMSVVGPRPHMLSHTEQYSRVIDRFMVRHFLKPGITGYAQVSGLRGETKTTDEMHKRVEADLWYLENWSFLLDMKIIFLTVWNVFKGDEKAF